MTAPRHTDRRGVSHDVADANDAAYASHTFIAPSRVGMTLPSERFCPSGCITRAEWERRHTAAYEHPAPVSNRVTAPAEGGEG